MGDALPSLQVAVGAIVSGTRVLISQRATHLDQGGCWEFPGGKIEPGETVVAALVRELQEELGITPTEMRPLMRVRYSYPERVVSLDVWKVTGYSGEPAHRERQPLRWVALDRLREFTFPPANLPIIAALELPAQCAITPPENCDVEWLVARSRHHLEPGDLLVLRQPQRAAAEYSGFAREAVPALSELGLRVLLTSTPAEVSVLSAAGLHLSSWRLRDALLECREVDGLLSAACHDAEELAQARQVGADFALLSPVRPTRSHPGMPTLGWVRFAELSAAAALPVYALGGLTLADLTQAWRHGAQGVAGIGMFYGE
ncbi:MAG: Nudix family hydrolase [Thiotrichales bacterium]